MENPWEAKIISFTFQSPKIFKCSDCRSKVRLKAYGKLRPSIERHIKRHKCNKSYEYRINVSGAEIWDWDYYQATMHRLIFEIHFLLLNSEQLVAERVSTQLAQQHLVELKRRVNLFVHFVERNQSHIEQYENFKKELMSSE